MQLDWKTPNQTVVVADISAEGLDIIAIPPVPPSVCLCNTAKPRSSAATAVAFPYSGRCGTAESNVMCSQPPNPLNLNVVI